MPTDLHTLAARLPDLPRWVETRWLLRTTGARFVADVDDPDSGVVVGSVVPLGAVIGRPTQATIGAALTEIPADFELIVQEDALEAARSAVPQWLSARGILHVRPDPPAVERDPVERDVEVSAPPDATVVERLWDEGRCWAAPAEAIATVVQGGLPVCVCHAAAVTEAWWDVGVETLPGYRRRGYARACFLALDRLMHERGRRPVWGADERNEPSLRLAASLGFRPVDRLWVLAPE